MCARTFCVPAPLVLGIGLLLCCGPTARAVETGALPWRADFARAQDEARSRNRPLWVQFTGSWCGYCVRMERETFAKPDIVALAREQFVPVRVRSDDREDLAESFGVSSLPATFLLTPSGDLIARREGYADPRSFRAFLDQALVGLAQLEPPMGHPGPRGEADRPVPLPPLPPDEKAPPVVPAPATPHAEVGDGRGTTAPVALGGLCPVSLIREQRRVPGRRDLALHREGQVYWFASVAHREAFQDQPDLFLPADGGRCVVNRLDFGRSLPGLFRHGVIYQDRIYLCADAEALRRFSRNPARYTDGDVADQGFCPHCRDQSGPRVRGSSRFTAWHAGRRYFFPDAEHLAAFRAAPGRYIR